MPPSNKDKKRITRTQTGVRIESRILKALAEFHDISLGDLIEGICLHVFEGKTPFSEEGLQTITDIKKVYRLDVSAADSHLLVERGSA